MTSPTSPTYVMALPFTVPRDGLYQFNGEVYKLNKGTVVDADLIPTLDPLRGRS